MYGRYYIVLGGTYYSKTVPAHAVVHAASLKGQRINLDINMIRLSHWLLGVQEVPCISPAVCLTGVSTDLRLTFGAGRRWLSLLRHLKHSSAAPIHVPLNKIFLRGHWLIFSRLLTCNVPSRSRGLLRPWLALNSDMDRPLWQVPIMLSIITQQNPIWGLNNVIWAHKAKVSQSPAKQVDRGIMYRDLVLPFILGDHTHEWRRIGTVSSILIGFFSLPCLVEWPSTERGSPWTVSLILETGAINLGLDLDNHEGLLFAMTESSLVRNKKVIFKYGREMGMRCFPQFRGGLRLYDVKGLEEA